MINIAIDGTTSSGKSTLSKELARRLNLKRLDTGALYRAVACAYERAGYKKVSQTNIQKFVKTLDVKVRFYKDFQHVIVNGIDETPFIRTEKISLLTSEISPYPEVRQKVLSLQQNFAKRHNCVMEGRDITTKVLPNATVKFYITASSEVRAKRRWLELKEKGEADSYEKVLEDLKLRDMRDETRENGRLEIAPDAIVVDSTNKTLKQTADYCEKVINKKLGKSHSH